MLLYFSSEKNKDIFYKIDEDIDIKLETTNNFSEYITQNMNNLNHIEFLAIDLEHIVDDEEEILNVLTSFRLFNPKIEIIIVALEKEKGDLFLSKIFKEGIYNFIVSKDEFNREKEIKACINKENNYASAIGYKVEEVTQISKEKENSNFFKNAISNLKKAKSETKEKPKKLKELKKIQQKTQYIQEQKSETEEMKVISEDFGNDEMNSNFAEKTEISKKVFSKCNNKKSEEVEKQILEKETLSKKQLDEQINEIYGNNNFLSVNNPKKERDTLVLEEMNESLSFLFYYNKKVGIYDKNNGICLVDANFEKEEIKSYLESIHINYMFKDDIFIKVKKLPIN